MPLISTEAIILQTFAYSETSKILRLLTRTHGVRSAIARGALRPRSRYGGVLEPFSVGTATLYLKDGRELQTLSAFELGHSGQALGRDLVRFGAASLLAELVLRTASEEADIGRFTQLRGALMRLEAAEPARLEAVALGEAWAMIARLGFAPALETCSGCGRTLDAAEPAVFDYAAGTVRCGACAPALGPEQGRSLPGHARMALLCFCRGEPAAPERTAAHWALLSRFLAHHVLEGGSLRSLEFLSEAIERRACAG
ncbi:MAG TPA: DNA repair protein RecO [Longimicrobiales bacterium]